MEAQKVGGGVIEASSSVVEAIPKHTSPVIVSLQWTPFGKPWVLNPGRVDASPPDARSQLTLNPCKNKGQ
ncbi:MAG: hypothetical protein AAF572_12045 [Cyanobacteria bacterium P01_B01_bin.77]